MIQPAQDFRDTTESFCGALIQHGPDSDRIYLMDPGSADHSELAPALVKLAQQQGYSKIFAKVPAGALNPWETAGFKTEARVPGFFGGADDGLFLGLFLDPARAESAQAQEIEDILNIAQNKTPRASEPLSDASKYELPPDSELFECSSEDTQEMALLYGEVFPSYPFPIQDAGYLQKVMKEDTVFFGIRQKGKLVALNSAEQYPAHRNAEMTDFATLPEARGQSLARILLQHAENHIRVQGFRTAYTIARAISPGMNITFANNDYRFGGTLINNTQISGQIESMNIWYKSL